MNGRIPEIPFTPLTHTPHTTTKHIYVHTTLLEAGEKESGVKMKLFPPTRVHVCLSVNKREIKRKREERDVWDSQLQRQKGLREPKISE